MIRRCPVPTMLPHYAFLLILLVDLHCLSQNQVGAAPALILEEGYSVSTVLNLNGNKPPLPINPRLVLPGGAHNLLVLDNSNSAFYTIAFPISQESDVKRFSGNGSVGFADGDLSSAMFNRPENFAVDLKGNVYVADRINHAIRKITKSGVTTIAGGRSGKPGKVDGPAQDASFSEDFELTFVQEACALLISDRANRLIRQINLKQSDCESSSHWQLGASASVLLGVSCLILGSVLTLVGVFVVYPFMSAREVLGNRRFSETWKHCQINLERRVVTACSDIKSAVASSTTCLLAFRVARMCLSHLSLMFSIGRVEKQTSCSGEVSLLDSDVGTNHETTKSDVFANQLMDLVSFDELLDSSKELNSTLKRDAEDCDRSDVSTCGLGSIDAMMHANLLELGNQPTETHPWDVPSVSSSNLVKRK